VAGWRSGPTAIVARPGPTLRTVSVLSGHNRDRGAHARPTQFAWKVNPPTIVPSLAV
jgi:hypothetical protein